MFWQLVETIVMMVQNQTMPQTYYWDVRRIYAQKTWRIFSFKGSISIMITIQNRSISLYRVRLLLARVIGGERVLFDPGNPATFKIILLLSDIIPMTLSFIFHFFSFFVEFLDDYLEKVLIPDTKKGAACANGSSIVYNIVWLLAIHSMLGWN